MGYLCGIMLLSLLFWLLLGYLAYRFVFGFLLPLVRTTRQVRKSFREMNQRMNEHFGGAPGPDPQRVHPSAPPAGKDDYIDFEEISD